VRRRLASCIALFCCLAGGLLVATPAASAAGGFILPVTAVSDVLMDGHGHIYVSQGAGSTGLLVVGTDGSVVSNIPEGGAGFMALSSDGATLFVCDQDDKAVVAIDTTTLTETARWTFSIGPSSLAVVGSRVYLYAGVMYVIDTSAGTSAGVTGTAAEGANVVLSDPADPSRLLTMFAGGSPSMVHSMTLTSSTHVSKGPDYAGTDVGGSGLVPDGDGAHVLLVGVEGAPRLRTSDMTVDGTYLPGQIIFRAASTSAGGGLVALAAEDSSGRDVWVFKGGAQLGSWEVGAGEGVQALAWAPDGHDLAVVSASYPSSAPVFRLQLFGADLPPTELTISGAASVARAAPLNLTGTFAVADTPTPGQTVTVSRTDRTGTTVLGTTVTGAGGAWSFLEHPRWAGSVTYTVTFPGSAQYASSSASRVVNVIGATPSLTLSSPALLYPYGAATTVTAHLGATYSNHVMSLYVARWPGVYKLIGTYTEPATGGSVSFRWVMSVQSTFLAVFDGDGLYAPTRVTRVLRAVPRLTETLHGAYTSSGGVAVFHHTVAPGLTATLYPAVVVCITYRAQYYSGGAWHPAAPPSLCFSTGGGPPTAYLNGTKLLGVEYRMQAVFAGGQGFYGTTGAWVYFRFVT
jgi:hypothetical protein